MASLLLLLLTGSPAQAAEPDSIFLVSDDTAIGVHSSAALGNPIEELGILWDPGGADIPIGGDFMLFLGAQYQFPLVGTFIDGVFFVDSGTVNDAPGFDEYRVGVGAGLRIYIPQLGPTPMAFDFAIPVMKQENDQTEVFSFSAELPF